jgi:hypothetical protein
MKNLLVKGLGDTLRCDELCWQHDGKYPCPAAGPPYL